MYKALFILFGFPVNWLQNYKKYVLLWLKIMVNRMNKKRLFRVFLASVVCTLFINEAQAQTGQRYAEPVFDEVNVVTAIPYSSAIKEGDTSPTTLYLDFYEPVGDTLSARPLVITVFGGAFVAGGRDYSDMQAYCTRLAQHGYVAASIDYRLLSIWNLNQTSLIREAYMASQDVSAAIRFLKYHSEEYGIDADQVFLLGNSAGSIAILCEIFIDEDERPAETYESPDLGSMHSSGFEEYAGVSPAVAGAIPHWGGVADLGIIEKEEYVPLCMIHGTDDTTVPYDSGYCYAGVFPNVMPYMYGSQAIVNQLDEMNISDYEFHPFEGEGHAFYFNALYQLNGQFDTCFSISRDFLYQHLCLPTALPDLTEQNVSVYPNPATSQVTVCVDESMQGKPFRVVVMDVMGRKLVAQTQSSSKVTIDTSLWPSGVYFLQVEQEGFCGSRKIVKQ